MASSVHGCVISLRGSAVFFRSMPSYKSGKLQNSLLATFYLLPFDPVFSFSSALIRTFYLTFTLLLSMSKTTRTNPQADLRLRIASNLSPTNPYPLPLTTSTPPILPKSHTHPPTPPSTLSTQPPSHPILPHGYHTHPITITCIPQKHRPSPSPTPHPTNPSPRTTKPPPYPTLYLTSDNIHAIHPMPSCTRTQSSHCVRGINPPFETR